MIPDVSPLVYVLGSFLFALSFVVGYAIPDLEDCRREFEDPEAR